MKTLIKAAITYKATIPTDTNSLAGHLAEKKFAECTEFELRSVGFVPPTPETQSLVQTFPGGLAFRVRIDQKIIPAATVKAEVEKRVEAAKVHTGRKPGKALRAEMKHEVMDELCRRALVKTVASITCFYDIANGYLIVPTSSKKIADVCTSLLVHAVGSVKTETINVSNVKHGLTTRMLRWLDDDAEAFGAFAPCDEAALAAEGRKVAVKMLSLQQARDGLKEALRDGLHVTSIGLHFDGIDFRLTSDFTLKGIAFADPSVPEEEEDLWAADAAIQAGKVSAVINELTAMLSYQDAATEGGAA